MAKAEDIQNAYHEYQAKAYIKAEISIRGVLAKNPNDADALRLGALTALSLNQVVTAQSRLAKACLLCNLTAEIANTSGNISKAAGNWIQAESAYKKALELDSAYKPVRANLIDLLVNSGQPDRALLEIESQAKQYSETNLMRLARVSALMKIGEYDTALIKVKLIDENYDSEKVASIKVRLFFHLGQYDEMQSAAKLIPANSEYTIETLGVMANAYAMQNDWTAFHNVIDSACRSSDALPETFIKSMQLLTRSEFPDLAENVRARAQVRFSENVSILVEKANHSMRDGDFSKSCELFKSAMSMRPGDFQTMLNYAEACLGAKQYDLAQHLIQGAFQQSPNNQFLFALAATLKRARGEEYKALYDYENFVQVYDLDPPKDYKTIEQFNIDLKTSLERLHDFQSAPLNQSLRGGTQTNVDLSFVNDPVLKTFFQAIDTSIGQYMESIGRDSQHPFTQRNTGSYRVNGAWSVRLSPNGHHVNHVHPMGWISSSYYVDVPSVIDTSDSQEGWIKFGEPGVKGLDLPAEKFVQPKSGRLVLFPSYMWHGTIPFSGAQTRLTLPFDIVPA